MIKVVLDANQYISATISPKGNPAIIYGLVKSDQIELFVSKKIIAELRRVFFYPHIRKIHKQTNKEIEYLLSDLSGFANLTKEGKRVNVIKDDPSDNIYLECAIEGEVDFIISGDHHLTDLKSFQGINIISPTEFLKILKKNSKK